MSNAKIIWDKLISAGMTAAGAAGLMGNLKAESALNPGILEVQYQRKFGMTSAQYTAAVDAGKYTNFSSDKAGYGLAQWTYSTRKKSLLEFAKKRGCSIADLGMQLDFLILELHTYSRVWDVLTHTDSVKEASDSVMCDFERPADTSSAARTGRAKLGKVFYDEFASAPTATVMEPTEGIKLLLSEIASGVWGADWESAILFELRAGISESKKDHVVASGDTLTKIAKTYGTTIAKILSDNKATYPDMTADLIRVGWRLKV